MSQIASLARFAGAAMLALTWASACGGKSFDEDGGNAGGASSQAGNSSQAGSITQAGASQAGTTQGGATSQGGTPTSFAGTPAVSGSSTGGASSTGGSGAGGAYNEACSAPPLAGPCEAAFTSWHHDPSTGICRPFTYGGCGGNANRYASRADCQKACWGQGPNYDTCKQPTDCVVAGTGCCGVCDSPGLTELDFIAYNRMFESALSCGAIPKGLPAPGDGASDPIACAPCPRVAGGALDYFVPDCFKEECTVVDLRDPTFASCTRNDECFVHYGNGCCEQCGGNNPIALRVDAPISRLLCGDSPVACPPCVPPMLHRAICSPEGRCAVEELAR
jgi:Kunitz/Bovine pancreatic trypsin inhibitor domain